MGARRALIVDDSKSARLFLARALEKFDIDVDSAETAEAAIDYLVANRPDVIFMDHLMPGMDGLQAVQAIKNDPRTATIPIMMYTSQEGELYLGQARALGALGVLPKQIKPADVSKVLYQLHLVADRRNPQQTTFTPAHLPQQPADAAASPLTGQIAALREQGGDLRRSLLAALEAQSDSIVAEVRAMLLDSLPPRSAPPSPAVAEDEARIGVRSSRPERLLPASLGVAALSLLIAAIALTAWVRTTGELRDLRAQLAARSQAAPDMTAVAAAGASPAAATTAALGAAAPPDSSAQAGPVVLPVPYGADALGGPRLEAIRQILGNLQRQKATGVVELRSFPGRFCLMGNQTDGYSPAPDETLFSRCDLVGNPSDEALTPTQRIPLPLANLIAGVRAATHGALQVQTATGEAAAVPYPPRAVDLTAGAWNRVAMANNRLEIRLR
ncbi:MAG: response regulator [Proteobacteria bacterium]|nr:response regulator [Pseudomonadota bacterium]